MGRIHIKPEGWLMGYDKGCGSLLTEIPMLDVDTLLVKMEPRSQYDRGNYERFMDMQREISCPFRKFSYKRVGDHDVVHIHNKKYEFSHYIEGAYAVVEESTSGMRARLDLREAIEITLPSEDEEDPELMDSYDEESFDVHDFGFLYIFAEDDYLVGRYLISLDFHDGENSHCFSEVISVFWDKRGRLLGVGSWEDCGKGSSLLRFDDDMNYYIEDAVFEHGLADLPY